MKITISKTFDLNEEEISLLKHLRKKFYVWYPGTFLWHKYTDKYQEKVFDAIESKGLSVEEDDGRVSLSMDGISVLDEIKDQETKWNRTL